MQFLCRQLLGLMWFILQNPLRNFQRPPPHHIKWANRSPSVAKVSFALPVVVTPNSRQRGSIVVSVHASSSPYSDGASGSRFKGMVAYPFRMTLARALLTIPMPVDDGRPVASWRRVRDAASLPLRLRREYRNPLETSKSLKYYYNTT